MKSFKLFLEGLSSKERADIKAALDDGKTVTGTSKYIDGKFKILKFTTVVIGVNRIPRALIDDGDKEKYIDTKAIDSFKINESTKEGKGLWHNIHQKRKRGEKMRKKGEKGAPTDDAIKKAQLKACHDKEKMSEGSGKSEPWEDGFKRRVVKTTKPEHKDKGYNWRIKGKDRDEVTIKLYKSKPNFAEFKKQMKRVAGHEFG